MRRRNTARVWWGRLLAPLLLLTSCPALADPPLLELPIACTPGVDCHILRYVDRDPGPGVRDYACGALTGDGHSGTDFALATLAEMVAGVPVLAAAPGRVRGLRDGMPDIDTTLPAAPDVSGRECGNGVAISHDDGWETRYCHLREGSVAVRKGERVAAGTVLGMVGMSGQASFPHVHFTLQKGNEVIDPFRPDAVGGCGGEAVEDMWRAPIGYHPGGFLDAGVAERVPGYDEIKAGLPEVDLPGAPAALVLWGFAFGGQAGDVVAFDLAGPDGPVGAAEVVLAEDQPRFFRAWGKRARAGGFPAGAYSGTMILRRGGVDLGRREIGFSLPARRE